MTDVFLKYLQYEKRYSNHTLRSYKNDLSQLLKFLDSNYPETGIEEANHAILRDWIISLSESGLKENSINRKLVTIRSFFKFLLKKGSIEKNPVTKLSNLKNKKGLPQFLREKDLNMIMDDDQFAEGFIGKRDHLILEILYGTGIRLSELIGLKIKNVDVVNNSLKVLGKRNKERIIPITKSLGSLIKNYIYLKNEEFCSNVNEYLIVSNNGEKSYPMMINRIVKKYLQGIQIDKKSPHIF